MMDIFGKSADLHTNALRSVQTAMCNVQALLKYEGPQLRAIFHSAFILLKNSFPYFLGIFL